MCGEAMWAANASGPAQDFEHDESIRPDLRLNRTDARSVGVRRIFDATLFRPHRRDVGAKRGQELVAAARLGGYDGDHTEHCRSRYCRPAPGRGRQA